MNRRRTSLVLLTVSAVTGLAATTVHIAAAGPLAGSQGTDTALAPTESQVSVPGRGPFAGLTVTVNQTANLTNQAVSVTWTGAEPTRQGPGRFAANYLQIMQCWGDDDGTVPDNPGPPPEQCVQGAVAGTYGGVPAGIYPNGFALSRVISRSTWANFDPAVGVLDARTTNVWRPFRSVDGTTVDIQTDPTFNPAVVGGNFWQNPYFNIVTTNEIGGAATFPDGTGAELMQVLTGVESSGLGCGQRVQPDGSGGRTIPRCWIVVVPRGEAADENAGTPFEANAAQNGVVTSPLAPEAWQHRIAIPIEFNPVDTPCALGADERRIAGSELTLAAVASWQPALCAAGGLPPFSYATVGDGNARQQLVSGATGGPGMVSVSRPVDPEVLGPSTPVVYAPITASGLVIGFNVERSPSPTAPDDAQRLAGVRIADINLTPRLVAKLLTQSYASQVSIVQRPDYPWLTDNAQHLGTDPDFVQFNPEFQQLQVANGRTFGGLQLPAGNSDAARQVWEWVLADPEARAWLDGAPDAWGMRVNPIYSTNAALNPTGSAFGEPAPDSFPKADPYCYQAPAEPAFVPPALCGTDWMPYTRGVAESARIARVASDGARINVNPFAQSAAEYWSRSLPQFLGRRAVLSLTDTPSAAQFGLQAARLSRAGDNGADRVFVAPDVAGLGAGVGAMRSGVVASVLEPDFDELADGAYPLTTLTYAAVSPLRLDDATRGHYASFIEYAVGAGQVPGLALGQLPPGYLPLPDDLRSAALAAATAVREMQAPPDPPTPTTTAAPPAAVPTTVPAPTGPTTVPSPPAPSVAPASTTTTTTTVPFPVPDPPPPLPGQAGTPFPSPGPGIGPTEGDPQDDLLDEDVGDDEGTDDRGRATTTTVPAAGGTQRSSPPSSSTPFSSVGARRLAVPALGAVSLGSAAGALWVGRRPRRGFTPLPGDAAVASGSG